MENQDFLVLLDARIKEIARAIFLECDGDGKTSAPLSGNAPAKLREQLAIIKAKEHVTIKEAALLLSCSESHIRKLVMLARKGKTRRPLPCVDLEGVTVFPREALFDWARPTPQMQVVKYEAA
jgi:Helix-turn-helix domain